MKEGSLLSKPSRKPAIELPFGYLHDLQHNLAAQSRYKMNNIQNK
jgi:hypothetical protein